MSGSREYKVTGCLPLLVICAPWWVGMYVIAKATVEAIF